MKRIIFLIILIVAFLFIYMNVNASSYDVVIPDAAIRVRVIANSNSFFDQSMKMKVREYVSDYFSSKLDYDIDIDGAREIISESIDELERGIYDIFGNNQYDIPFVIHYGKNHFPSKDYKGVRYEEGDYESLVVTIGRGEGDNWWCVLFPPLCLLEASEDNTDDVSYQFFVKKVIDYFFH